MPTRRGASSRPRPGRRAPLQLPAPESFKLANGLTRDSQPRDQACRSCRPNLVVRTGSDANPLDKPGLANFTAAMLDEGTATRNAPQIADAAGADRRQPRDAGARWTRRSSKARR